MEKNADMLQGQQIAIVDLNLNVDSYEATLIIKALINKSVISMVFYNVSNLTIDGLSMPFEICGLQIVDNKDRGWEKSKRFTVLDFEDQNIHFYCEYYKVV